MFVTSRSCQYLPYSTHFEKSSKSYIIPWKIAKSTWYFFWVLRCWKMCKFKFYSPFLPWIYITYITCHTDVSSCDKCVLRFEYTYICMYILLVFKWIVSPSADEYINIILSSAVLLLFNEKDIKRKLLRMSEK